MRIFCSICKDIFIPYSEVHVTNCGHLYHGTCISKWFKQHKTCPQCRAKILQPFRVYFDVEKDNVADSSTLEHEVETLTDKLREAEREKESLKHDYNNVSSLVESLKECTMSLSQKNDVLKTSVKALKGQVTKLTKQNEAVIQLESEVEMWKCKVSALERIETVIKGSVEEANKMMANTPVTELAVRQLCTYVGVLKTQLHKLEEKNFKLAKENKTVTKALAHKLRKDSTNLEEIENLREVNSKLENELLRLKTSYENNKVKHHDQKEEKLPPQQEKTAQTKLKRSFFDIDVDFDDSTDIVIGHVGPVKEDKTINHWEKLVCAGPSKNVGISIQKTKSFSKSSGSTADEYSVSRSNSVYEYDGFGGRKKLRLGCPTPFEEFEKIKKKKEKRCPPVFQHKKIIDYYQLE